MKIFRFQLKGCMCEVSVIDRNLRHAIQCFINSYYDDKQTYNIRGNSKETIIIVVGKFVTDTWICLKPEEIIGGEVFVVGV